MLIVALVLAVVGLAALVTAVITSNELIAWVCIAASVIGVLLLIIDAVRSRSKQDDGDGDAVAEAPPEVTYDEDYPEEAPVAAGQGDDAHAADGGVAEPGHYYSEEAGTFTPGEDSHEHPTGNDSAKN